MIEGCGKYDSEHPELTRSCGDILFNNTIYYCESCQEMQNNLDDLNVFIIALEKAYNKKDDNYVRANIYNIKVMIERFGGEK